MENNSIFIDTNVWVALFNSNDTLHERARNTARSLRNDNFELVTSNYVLAECFTVIAKKCGMKAVCDFRQYINNRNMIRVMWIEETMDDAVWRIFSAEKNTDVSFIDASNIALMKEYNFSFLLTFDRALQKAARTHNIAVFDEVRARESV